MFAAKDTQDPRHENPCQIILYSKCKMLTFNKLTLQIVTSCRLKYALIMTTLCDILNQMTKQKFLLKKQAQKVSPLYIFLYLKVLFPHGLASVDLGHNN